MPRNKSVDSIFVVNAQDCCRFLGVNGAALKELVAEGMPTAHATGPRGGDRYDLCHVHTWMLERREKQILESEDQHRLQSLERERARLTRAQSEKTEFEVAQKKRELVPIMSAEGPIRTFAKSLQDRCAALPMRIKNRMPQLTSTELDFIRDEIARWQNECADLPNHVEW